MAILTTCVTCDRVCEGVVQHDEQGRASLFHLCAQCFREMSDRFVLISGRRPIILDRQTWLEWYVLRELGNTSFAEARFRVENLRSGGGWRLPTLEELCEIFFPEWGVANGYLHPLFGFDSSAGGVRVWSSDARTDASSWLFDFFGGQPVWEYNTVPDGGMAFAVRQGQSE